VVPVAPRAGRRVGRRSCRLAIEPRKPDIPGADRVTNLEGNTDRRLSASDLLDRRGQRLCMGAPCSGTGRSRCWRVVLRTIGPRGEGQRAEACDDRRREVRPHHSSHPHEGRWQSSGEARGQTSTAGQGVGRAKGGGRGKRKKSTRAPGLRTGKPRQRGLIAYGKWHERRKGKGSPPYSPCRCDVVAPSVFLTEARRGPSSGHSAGLRPRNLGPASPGVDGMTCDAYGEGQEAGCAILKAAFTLGPIGHSRAYVPTTLSRPYCREQPLQ
jgi:hypothetical protein